MLSGWKFGAPRPDEMFYTLYDRARALESQEKQNSSNLDRIPHGDRQQMPVRKEQKSGTKGHSGEGNLKNQSQGSQQSSPSPWRFNREVRKCNKCQEGHIVRYCPHSMKHLVGGLMLV